MRESGDQSGVQAGWVIVAACAVAALSVWFAMASAYADAREIEGQCFQNSPPSAVVTEDASAFESDRTALPAGRSCVYDAQGGGTVSTQTGWPTTIAAFAGTGIAALALGLAFVRRRRMNAMQHVLTSSALLAVCLGWVSIVIFASKG
ncbi:LPXTG cell wall anchor domain-containing protein [Microbacterium sp. CGR2]|nr:LPXTG cell wall anchor domain-containing protein [Microbacterium sp. CGR2]